ncbi:LPS assembly lipoprotein LptE [Litorisediminicola beolgyonensis]|uniref:LPS assembly lipoprotein LptE n=1 Tax=Litorisediminicola beolgyonensis TaxID=1173614 RepID=A0ABW3ZDV2_9RHOB
MSWCDRRTLLAGLVLLPACGFRPVYGPGGGAEALQGAIAFPEPEGRSGYLLQRRLEERFGRASLPRYRMIPEITLDEEDLGTTSTGSTTRYRILGEVDWRLEEIATGETVLTRRVESFTGYSATGSNVATLAAERDALERLMVALADRIVDQLLLFATP